MNKPLFFIFIVVFLTAGITQVSAASRLVVLEEVHSLKSADFSLILVEPYSKLNSTVNVFLVDSSLFPLLVIENPPNISESPLSTVVELHAAGSSLLYITTMEFLSRLSASPSMQGLNSSPYLLVVIPNPPNETTTQLSTEFLQHSSSSNFFKAVLVFHLTKLNSSISPHHMYSSYFMAGIPEVMNITVIKLNSSIWVHYSSSSSFIAYLSKPEQTSSDLIVEDLCWQPSFFVDGDSITFTASVRNIGNGSTKKSFYVSFYVDGFFIGSVLSDPLAANESKIVSQGWTASPGIHNISVKADWLDVGGNQINESNELNNELTESLPAVGFPDLTVEVVSFTPSSFSEGDVVSFNYTVRNLGFNTVRTFKVDARVDGISLGVESVSGLASNSSMSFIETWVASQGMHNFTAAVDSSSVVPESDESNNDAFIPLPFVGSADLTVADLSWTPLEPDNGDAVSLKATVSNIGSADTSVGFYTRFYVDGSLINEVYKEGMYGGETVNFTVEWTASPGNHTYRVVVDYLNNVSETNESNNELSADLPFIGFPDLAVLGLSYHPEAYSYGDTVYLRALVRNLGASVLESFKISFYINNRSIGYLSLDSLEANESVNVSGYWTASSSNPVYSLRIDSGDDIPELNESNNRLSMTLPQIDLPDLSINYIHLDPSSPYGNQPTLIKATVFNLESYDVSRDFIVSFYVDGDFIGFDTVKGLQAMGSKEVSVPWTGVEGAHNFTAVVDYLESNPVYSDVVPESDESNNVVSGVYTVNPALNLLSISEVSIPSECNFNSTETALIQVIDEYSNLVDADHIYAVVERPDSVVESINLSRIGQGRYRLSYRNTGVLGNYLLSIHALKSNYSNASHTSSFMVRDLSPPSVRIVSPVKGDVVQGNVTVTVEASDYLSPLSSVKVGIDSYGYMPCSLNNSLWVCVWDSSPFRHGLHTIYAKATDGEGNIGETGIVVDVFREYPDFRVSPGSFTFRLHPNESLSQAFVFENSGTVPLSDINVSTNLGWVTVNSSLTNLSVGETAYFTLTASSPDYLSLPPECADGCIIGGSLILEAGGITRYYLLRIDLSLPDIDFSVTPLSWSLGAIPPAYTETKYFTLRNSWDKNISVNLSIPSGSYLSVDSLPPALLGPNESANFSIRVSVPDNAPQGSFTGSFAVAVNDSFKGNHETGRIYGSVRYPLSVSPKSWGAGFMNPNSTVSRTFNLSNMLASVEDITLSVEGDISPFIRFDTFPALGNLSVGEGLSFTVSLMIPVNASEGFYRGKVIVSTAKRGSIVIPVTVDVTFNRWGYLAVNVVDNLTGEPISNAVVALEGGNGSYFARSDADGCAGFTVWSGNYNYLASGEEHLSRSGNIFIPAGDPDATISLNRKPIISVEVEIRDEYGGFLPIDPQTGLPVVQAEQTYHFRMSIVVKTDQVISVDDLYIPPEFRPRDIYGNPTDYTISRHGDRYTVSWMAHTASGFSYPGNDAMGASSGGFSFLTRPRPKGFVPLEVEGDMHFGGERFMVRAVIRNLEEDPNDPTAVPVNATGVVASLRDTPGVGLAPVSQNRSVCLGDVDVGESHVVQWLVKAFEVGVHHICVDVWDAGGSMWEGCANVSAIAPPQVDVKYFVPCFVSAGVPFELVANVTNPTELVARDFSIVFNGFDNLRLGVGESASKHVGNIPPGETKSVSWSLIPLVTGPVVDVIFQTFYSGGPVLSYEIRMDDCVELYCSNGVRDWDEWGIDCGGGCPNQDCCTNGYMDVNLGEEGVDCGGLCEPCMSSCPENEVVIWGKVEDNRGNGIGSVHIKIMDENPIDDTELWSGYTNSVGYYISSCITKYEFPSNFRDFYVVAALDNEVVNVQNCNPVVPNLGECSLLHDDTYRATIGTFSCDNICEKNLRFFDVDGIKVFNELSKAYYEYITPILSYNKNKESTYVHADIPLGGNQGVFKPGLGLKSVIYYQTNPSVSTIWHEYGHALHYQAVADGILDSWFQFNFLFDEGFKEGWAPYFGCIGHVKEKSNLDCLCKYYNIEDNNKLGSVSCNDDAHSRGIVYAQIFWDIKDGGANDDDPIDGSSLSGDSGEIRIWEIIEEKESKNINDFYDDFTSEYGFKEELCQIYLAHGVCYDRCIEYIPTPSLEPIIQQVTVDELFTISWSHMYGGVKFTNQISPEYKICSTENSSCMMGLGIIDSMEHGSEKGAFGFRLDEVGTYKYKFYSREKCAGVGGWSNVITIHVIEVEDCSSMNNLIGPNESRLHEVSIDPTISDASFYTFWSGSDLDLVLYTPNGTIITPYVAVVDPNIRYIENTSYEYYAIHNPAPGIWTMNITAINVSDTGEDYLATVFLTTNITLSLSTDKDTYDSPSRPVNIIANLTLTESPLTGAIVRAIIKKHDGVDNITLYDDGLHNDGQADDGVYAILYSNTSVGINIIQVTASGTIDEYQFVREKKKSIIMESDYDLTIHPIIIYSNNTPFSGDLITINATVRNIGDVNISNFLVGFYDGNPLENGTIIGVDEITENVEVGSNVSASILWRAKSKVNDVYVHVDPYHSIPEINELNNIVNRTINVTLTYQIKIIYAGTDKFNYSLNENITIYCVIQDIERDLLTSDIVYAKIANYTVNLSEYSLGHYLGTFNRLNHFDTYNLTIYANKTGYISDAVSTEFNVVCNNISKGDFNCNGVVDSSDYITFENIYKITCNDSEYNSLGDFDDDCDIDLIDFVKFVRRYEG